MLFNAIVHAPALRVGAKLNIAAVDQPSKGAFVPLQVGAEVRLRLGVCCPDHAQGWVTGRPDTDAESVLLTVGSQHWTIRKEGTGITDPGLFSETWLVVALAGEI